MILFFIVDKLPHSTLGPKPTMLLYLRSMIRHTQHFLDKLINILALNNYSVRNEKGNFKSGHCLKEQSRIILLNKNAPIESRLNFLCDVLRRVEIDESILSHDEQKIIGYLKQAELKI